MGRNNNRNNNRNNKNTHTTYDPSSDQLLTALEKEKIKDYKNLAKARDKFFKEKNTKELEKADLAKTYYEERLAKEGELYTARLEEIAKRVQAQEALTESKLSNQELYDEELKLRTELTKQRLAQASRKEDVTSVVDNANKVAIQTYNGMYNKNILTEEDVEDMMYVLNDPIQNCLKRDILEDRFLRIIKQADYQSRGQSEKIHINWNYLFDKVDINDNFIVKPGAYGIIAGANFGKQLVSSYLIDKCLQNVNDIVDNDILNVRFNERSDVSIQDKLTQEQLDTLGNKAKFIKDIHLVGGLYDLLPVLYSNSRIIIINSINSALYAMQNSTLIKGGIDKEKIDSLVELLQAIGEKTGKIIIFIYRTSNSELINGIENIILGSCWGVLYQSYTNDIVSDTFLNVELKETKFSNGTSKLQISKDELISNMRYLNWRKNENDSTTTAESINGYARYF